MHPLTPKQAKVLAWLRARIDKTGVCPSYPEIAKRFKMKSLNSVAHILSALEIRGRIKRGPANSKRSIIILEVK